MKLKPEYILILLLLVGCSGKKNEQEKIPATSKTQSTTQSKTYYINSAGNVAVGFVIIEADITIKVGDKQLKRLCKADDKCKYRGSDGNNEYEVKYKEGALKLRTESGVLLWKVKIQDDKIKLANNEEMIDPIEIKKKNNSCKISRGDVDLGMVDFGSESLPVLAEGEKEQVMIVGPTKEMASGILVLSDLAMDQRIILFAEVLNL